MARHKRSHPHGSPNRPRMWGKHAVSAALDNPDHVAIVIHNYRWRLGLAEGEAKYDDIGRKLALEPVLDPRTPFADPRLHDCTGCSMKQQCCPNMPNRRIMRSVHERSTEVAREIANTPQYRQSRRDRKKVEMLFAHLKRILKLGTGCGCEDSRARETSSW